MIPQHPLNEKTTRCVLQIRSRLDSFSESNFEQVNLFTRRVLGEQGESVRPIVEGIRDDLKASRA